MKTPDNLVRFVPIASVGTSKSSKTVDDQKRTALATVPKRGKPRIIHLPRVNNL